MRDLLGGKGAGLAEMTQAGVPVPPGFTITTEACSLYVETAASCRPRSRASRRRRCAARGAVGKPLGDPDDPLLVSVRSGAKFSMPGMMDTILNLGLNDRSVRGWPPGPATPASPGTATGASSRCSATSCSASRRRSSSTRSERIKRGEAGRSSTSTSPAADLEELVERLQARSCAASRRGGTSRRTARAARHGARRRLPLLEQRPRASTTASSTASPTTSAPRSTCRRWSSATWAPTSGTGRRLHAQPGHRREGVLRRVPA